MSYPVTVVIPTIDLRYEFLTKRCLPSVKAADPAEIVVVFGAGNGNEKRNRGALGAKQPYLLFVDDDAELRPECLRTMVAELERDNGAAFAYSDFTISVAPGVKWDHIAGDVHAGEFNPDRLRVSNFINTTSLIRTSVFPGFDPKLKKFQDWDLWLTMTRKGCRGAYVNKNLFTLHQIDVGITNGGVCWAEAKKSLFTKHGL